VRDESRSPSYEWLREKIGQTPPSAGDRARDVVWADGAKSLGVSRDELGRVEIFVIGDALVPQDTLVAENLVHDVWATRDGNYLAANRLVLPATPHLDGFAAFICAELVENGLDVDRAEAFARSEPVIAMALRRAGISNQALVGLAGELLFLSALASSTPDASAVVEAWAGSVPSSRDFQLGPVGVEVKTTTGSQSEHHIQGFHQIEFGTSVGGVPETHLFLLSIGIRWQPVGAPGRTIPGLVDGMLERLGDDDANAFLDKIRQYGGDASVGYDHRQHASNARFQQPFQAVFERLYDMADDRLEVLRSTDLEEMRHVDPSSVSFRLRLPGRVRGDLNPLHGMSAVASRLRSLTRQ
jgi:hypothetical protein